MYTYTHIHIYIYMSLLVALLAKMLWPHACMFCALLAFPGVPRILAQPSKRKTEFRNDALAKTAKRKAGNGREQE